MLRVAPGWTAWAPWALIVALVLAGFGAARTPVNEYATGPALVQATDRVALTAPTAAVVESIQITPGERVAAGDVLVRFRAEAERDRLDRARDAEERALLDYLREPGNADVRQHLARSRAERILSEDALNRRSVVSPRDGIVEDIRIRPGQSLSPGEPIVSVYGEHRQLRLVAAIPGRYRPQVDSGDALRLEVSGYAHAYVQLQVDVVGHEVVGPSAVRRYLGADWQDAVPLDGPIVLVEAELPSAFTFDGETCRFFPGMQGRAEIQVRRSNLLATLIPALRAWAGGPS